MDKQQLHDLIDQLPPSEIEPAERYLRFLIERDEPALDPEMLKRIDAARANPSTGIPHDEVLRDFGL
jgi:hypothetical protein